MPTPADHPRVYSSLARRFHWWTVVFVAVLIPVGFYMSYRGNTLNIWDSTTNAIYNAHKLGGFIVLWLVVARLIYRFRNGAPEDEPTLTGIQRLVAHVTHWAMYGLLIIIPLLGWAGVSRYGALNIWGPISLPPLLSQNQEAAGAIFWLHGAAAILLLLLIAAHIGAALMHHLILKDGTLRRMLPTLKPKS
jgi:cytochrome b561